MSRLVLVTRARPALALVLGALCLVLALAPTASGEPSATGSARAPVASAAPEIPLPELPDLQPIDLGPASAGATESLESRIAQLVRAAADDPLAPVDLAFLTADLSPDIVAAIRQRRAALGKDLDGSAAKKLLQKARKAGRTAIRKQRKANKKKAKEAKDDPTGDWLVFILALPKRDSQNWRDLAEVYGMLRMLEHLGTTPAVREMIAHYSTFGELVRIDLQRAIERLGHKAVPALIEAKQHEARKVRRWARRQLDLVGRAIPGEAVSTSDPIILADVLRAFGRIRDLDATRIILSYANSDRVQLRRAAREAVGAMGEAASFHLKDAYKSVSGATPPRGWDHRRTARELFRLHDRARLAEVYELLAAGQKSLQGGRYEEAAQAFDQVLARAPLIEGRDQMARAYLGQADILIAEKRRPEALAALRKALRLAPDGPDKPKVESRLAFLEGQALVERGTPDRFILRRAIELDPDNEEAKKLLASLDDKADKRQSRSKRTVAAVVVGLIGLSAILVLAFWRRPKRDRKRREERERTPAADQGAAPAAHDEGSEG
ncbi:MAG: hypothetical protein JRI68_09465 [Deltaproteobacteria bacterium]|nr:hypothetical protein [Deltaproteobacteria bacterium]